MTKKHDDVIEWKHYPRYLPFLVGIHWSPVDYSKRQWRETLQIIGWANNRDADDLRRYRAYYDVTVMTASYNEKWYKIDDLINKS